MIRIAVVGNIGSGKSFVAKSFGLPVFNADKEVSLIYKKNKFFFKKLNKKIPKFIKSFPIDKKEILSCILANNKNLKIITKIIHPIVRKKMNLFIKKNKKKRAIVLDIPLYLENRLNKKGDIIIYVDAKQNPEQNLITVFLDDHYFISANNGIIPLISSVIKPTKIIEMDFGFIKLGVPPPK